MAEVVLGLARAEARIHAVGSVRLTRAVMNRLAVATVRGAKQRVPRKTGNLGRSIVIESVTDTSAAVAATARYAAYVELGTKPHDITPRAKKALRWAKGEAGGPFRRLTGSPRSNAPASAFVFARRVHHPGTRPHPYLVPAAEAALAQADLRADVVSAWNGAL